jgi:hypothetical protein
MKGPAVCNPFRPLLPQRGERPRHRLARVKPPVMAAGQAALSTACSGGEGPGQQVGDAVDRMIGDASKHIAQVGLGIEAVELGGLDQGVDCGRALAASAIGMKRGLVARSPDPLASANSRRHRNRRLGAIPCRRATADTEVVVCADSATIARFSCTDHRRTGVGRDHRPRERLISRLRNDTGPIGTTSLRT